MKILVADPVSEEGIDILRSQAEVDIRAGLRPEELVAIIGDYKALVVRSQTKVTGKMIEAGKKLQVIARAGVGVNNIDVEEATRHGVLVVNSPEGNIVSTAEHTIAMLLALARKIPRASSLLQSGVWERQLKGTEIRRKVLGVIGLGRVGTEVAQMAKGLHMNIIAYDPLVSEARAGRLGVQLVEMKALLKASDFITVHVPLNSSTRGLIGREELKLVKPTALISVRCRSVWACGAAVRQ
ncbi:hydroxyacid dehydrogenase [Chloroflexota bacterium]